MRFRFSMVGIGAALLLAACGVDSGSTRPAFFARLGEPIPTATAEQLAAFERGKDIALRRFTPDSGLGPTFNVSFCGGCHEKPVTGGGAGHYRDFLLVGAQASNGGVIGVGNNGVQPQFSLESGRAPDDIRTNVTATRNPIPFFGAGLLFEIPESEILKRADPGDLNGDGISGRINTDQGFVGRFGRKAQSSSIQSFIRGPLFNHIGITTNPLTAEERAQLPMQRPGAADTDDDTTVVITIGGQTQNVRGRQTKQVGSSGEPTVDDDAAPDPELSPNDLFDLVSFTMLLAPPEPNFPNEVASRGRGLFDAINCTGCHVPALEGPRGPVPAYTDLLIHDMGQGLADGFTFGQATGREYRTQPLWGVVAVAPYLHDGRADTLDAAIRWHGGEASDARDGYVALEEEDQVAIIAFLESLGGADQRSEGLLPPSSVAPEVGLGSPLPSLTDNARSVFALGRTLFDLDFGYERGVGPLFNGDSCRACHFEPTIGGAGPPGVDAMRHGVITGDVFTAPSIGTFAPRFSIMPVRPGIDEQANFFEPRQTPSLFGLGLVELIPRETIEALADPNDANADGISGRPHILPDDRLGRFGWKADVPSLREFVRDALSNELGITVPPEPALTFGTETDDDMVTDPEATEDVIGGISTFVAGLAPPPRERTDTVAEDAGENVFATVGCADCHVPTLITNANTPVSLYSDLLLHETLDAGSPGIESGEATMTEFRTAPLWGIRDTAPYMHDGRAATLEDAIDAHAGEATQSKDAFGALSAQDRDALLSFLRSL